MNRPRNHRTLLAAPPSRRSPLPLLPFLPPKSVFPPLCFQGLAHSSAIRWGWGGAAPQQHFRDSPLATRHSSLATSSFLTPLLPLLQKSSILRIPQPLCLPLLRKLPGCISSLPTMERVAKDLSVHHSGTWGLFPSLVPPNYDPLVVSCG